MLTNKSNILTTLVLAAFFLSACQPQPDTGITQPPPSSTPAPPEQPGLDQPIPDHRIQVRQADGVGEFYDIETGQTFTPRGANYVFVPFGSRYSNMTLRVGVYDPQLTRDDFQRLAALGYNTVRVFIDQCNQGFGCITMADTPGLNPEYMDNVADMMQAAREAGIYILFTSNDLPDVDYGEEANQGANADFAGYRNTLYLRPEAISATRRYWRDILTALRERGAAFDAVLGWQLLNEQWMFADQPPLSLTAGVVESTTGTYDMADPQQKEQMVADGLVYYIDQMKEEILTHDPTALVTMGFFTPELVAPGWYVDTKPLLERSALDFFDLHAYSGELSFDQHAEAFGVIDYQEKPVILGEYGPFRHIYDDLENAARVTSQWAADSCAYGFDGWLYWAYYPANPEITDRTWGLIDEDNYLLELYSPQNQPDICQPVEVETSNLAFMKPASASRSLPAEPPEKAVDGDPATQWGAGADAPQSIEIDLQDPATVAEIRLLVAQFPAGSTSHQVLIQTAGETRFVPVHEFTGDTREGEWLVYTPDIPLQDVTAIRVVTNASPSWVAWKEIQVFAEPAQP